MHRLSILMIVFTLQLTGCSLFVWGDVDGGRGVDSGELRDGGPDRDAGQDLDAGAPPDASVSLDGGSFDARFSDAGPGEGDAGTHDAGLTGSGDAGGGVVDPFAGWSALNTVALGPASCLDSNDGAAGSLMTDCSGLTSQQWRFVDNGDGSFAMKTRYQGDLRCLDGNVPDAFLNGQAYMADCADTPRQQWVIDELGDTFLIKNRDRGNNECLAGYTAANGAAIMLECTPTTAQQWSLRALPGEGCAINADCETGVCNYLLGVCDETVHEQNCFDGADDDGDGFVDCTDPDCGLVELYCETPVTVFNHSFENPMAPGFATGWTSNSDDGTGGVAPASMGFSAAADKAQYHYLDLPALGGPDPSVTQSNVGQIGAAQVGRYTLIVAVGRSQGEDTTDGTVIVELLAGGIVVESTTVFNPYESFGPDTWTDVAVTAFVPPAHPAVGGDLSIRLQATQGTGAPHGRAHFDDVRLRYAPPNPLVVPNHSFEDPMNQGMLPTSWSTNGQGNSGGVDPGTTGFAAAADGAQFHYLNLPGFGGPSPHTTQSDPAGIGLAGPGAYFLTVAGGRRLMANTTDGQYVIELVAGGTVIGAEVVDDPLNTYLPETWNDIMATAVLEPGDPSVGQDLRVRLTAIKADTGNQGQFDNVRLDFVPYGAAP